MKPHVITILTTLIASFFAIDLHVTSVSGTLSACSSICAICRVALLTLAYWASVARFLAIYFHISRVSRALARFCPTGAIAIVICTLIFRLIICQHNFSLFFKSLVEMVLNNYCTRRCRSCRISRTVIKTVHSYYIPLQKKYNFK